MKKYTTIIKNRNGFNLSIRITKPNNTDKLAIIEHGLSGCKDEKHILILEYELSKAGYTVINMDATNSINESDSTPEGLTFSGHYNDLTDVIKWAKTQSFYKEPFTLAGHSLGACSILYYTENFPKEVNLLLLISFPWLNITSKLKQTDIQTIKNWKNTGFFNKFSKSRNKSLYIPYNFIKDLKKHNFLKKANKITAKTILIIGDLENKIRLDDNNKLYKKLNCEKEFIILKNTPHSVAKTSNNANQFRTEIRKILTTKQ
ncbi:MAG: alpha/beta hydrolase [Alphaproteobacteria bacterium]